MFLPTYFARTAARSVTLARFASTSARRVAPPPRGTWSQYPTKHTTYAWIDNIATPKAFLEAISKPRRDLANNSTCVSAVGEDWDAMFALNSEKLKGAGVPVKDRKYILWSLEKYRQGERPADFAHDVKKPKKVRGWGPRVQKGIRVRGMLRHGEKKL